MKDSGGTLFITTTTGTGEDGEGVCMITWNGWEGYASASVVRTVGEGFFTAAAIAELLAGLAKAGWDNKRMARFGARLLDPDKPMGHFDAVALAPGLTKQKEPIIIIARGPGIQGVIDPAEARETGRIWLEAALACMFDQNMNTALTDAVPGLAERERKAFFARLGELMVK